MSDVFELLDIARREDSYSSLLRHAFSKSTRLRDRVFAIAFPDAPRLQHHEVLFRCGLGGAGIVDLLLSAHDERRQVWRLFIENKIDSSESPSQTRRYLQALRESAERDADRSAGIFLTLTGDAASTPDVVPITHRELARHVSQCLPDFAGDTVLRLALEAYVRRATMPMIEASPEMAVGDLLGAWSGLLPQSAGPEALGNAIVGGARGGWTVTPIWIQGRGHGHPGLQFHRRGWCGAQLNGRRWRPENLDVHAEVELVEGDPGPIKIHFETAPYLTRSDIDKLANPEAFYAAREAFRSALHGRLSLLEGWRVSRRHLQAAIHDPGLDDRASVREVVEAYASQLDAVAVPIDEALAAAKRASGG